MLAKKLHPDALKAAKKLSEESNEKTEKQSEMRPLLIDLLLLVHVAHWNAQYLLNLGPTAENQDNQMSNQIFLTKYLLI